jgi:hypothetical protein
MKMKTKNNLTNYITKGFILASITISLMLNISAQKNQDFLASEKYTADQNFGTDLNADNNKKLVSSATATTNNSDASFETFLMKAAGININVSAEQSESSEENLSDESTCFENFLISAAGLNKVENSDMNGNISCSEKDLGIFLIHAAGLNSLQDINAVPADSEIEAQNNDLINFLVKAAGLYTYNNSIMK